MNNINSQQPMPYTREYEMAPNPAPIRHEDSAEAHAQAGKPSESMPPRQPMTPEQRGQFSSHQAMHNPAPSAGGADSGKLAQLDKENNELRDKLNQLVERFTPIILKLQQQVKELNEQLNGSKNPGKADAPPSQDAPGSPEVKPQAESPSTPPRAEDTPAPKAGTPRSFEELSAENKQLQETVDRLQTQFNTIVKQLQEQIDALKQKLSGAANPETQAPAPETQNPPVASSANDSDTPVGAPPKTDAQTPSPDASQPQPRTIEDLTRENQQLRSRIEAMMVEFTKVIAQLQQQIEQLSAQIKGQK